MCPLILVNYRSATKRIILTGYIRKYKMLHGKFCRSNFYLSLCVYSVMA